MSKSTMYKERETYLTDQRYRENLCTLDYLIYSSHKTRTQTLNHTLHMNGIHSMHCHYLPHINLKDGELKEFSQLYRRKNNRRLKINSVFRNPLERHISSFFQTYGSRPIRLNEVSDKSETIIYKYSVTDLIRKFSHELEQKRCSVIVNLYMIFAINLMWR